MTTKRTHSTAHGGYRLRCVECGTDVQSPSLDPRCPACGSRNLEVA